ncbi:hypothetical protein EMIT048CA2_10574 [Pseudomonas chlororaphis]
MHQECALSPDARFDLHQVPINERGLSPVSDPDQIRVLSAG